MYYYLLSSLKRRLILELQDSFAQHPLYAKIVPNIQNKYVFESRPQFGIVLKGASANKVALSGDNFVGTVSSHVMLAYVGEPAYPIEWVREDVQRIEGNGGTLPIRPGIYYIEILSVPTNPQERGTFAVDPLIEATDEPLLRYDSGIEREAQLQNAPSQGTLRIWENHRFLLREGVDYRVDYSNGSVEILARGTPQAVLTADYFFADPSVGPVSFQWNTADFTTLPGVVLAFGKRARVGDKVAIRVYPDRVDTANAFGGKFEVSFDLDVISTDPTQTEEITDLVIMYLWGQKKSYLELEGIEIVDISIGGEAEDTYDETADLWFYNASVSLQLRADWEIHVPLPLTLSRVTPTTPAMDAQGTPDRRGPSQNAIVWDGPTDLFFSTVPTVPGRNYSFERIR
jgi:hypothetical protein